MPKLNNLTLRANIDYNRLTGTDNFDDFFSNLALQLSAEVPIKIGRAQQVSFGVDASVSLYADPSRRSGMILAPTSAMRSISAAPFQSTARRGWCCGLMTPGAN